jgi:mannose-6-phosphate isomerase-like protein (cupin superfamily)
MPQLVSAPTQIEAQGQPPKIIREYIGRVNTATQSISVAHMTSPSGWAEPGQRPAFDEFTVVLRGELQVEVEDGEPIIVKAGQAIITRAGEWIRYSTPGPEGADYIAVCHPAFSPDTVHRDVEDYA